MRTTSRSIVSLGVLAIASALGPTAVTTEASAASLPRFDHVVVIVEENHSFSDVIGSSDAPYINDLASQGASFTNAFAETHPSQPNYLALFSGDTQGVSDDSCPQSFTGVDNLGNQLTSAGLTFVGYSESLPSDGYTGCRSGDYVRKHNPWVDFDNISASQNIAFSEFPTDFSTLPTVPFVMPNLQNDMHDGTIAQADDWLQSNLDPYVQWAKSHNSLLIVTWDEDDFSQSNQIPTVFVGAHVAAGQYPESINHYNVLRTLEDMYGLPALLNAANASSITDVWN